MLKNFKIDPAKDKQILIDHLLDISDEGTFCIETLQSMELVELQDLVEELLEETV